MIENLNNLVKENAQEAIINNSAIPNEKNEEVVKEASASIEDSLKTSLAGGNVGEVVKLFNGTPETVTSSPVTQQATGSFIEKLQSRFGVNFKEATNMANNLIPNVLKKLVNKTADPADKSFNIQDIFNQASGGKTIGMNVQAMMTKFKTGMDKDGDGDVDFQDVKAFFAGSGGVMDKVKGLFK
jgi:LysM repeat protein